MLYFLFLTVLLLHFFLLFFFAQHAYGCVSYDSGYRQLPGARDARDFWVAVATRGSRCTCFFGLLPGSTSYPGSCSYSTATWVAAATSRYLQLPANYPEVYVRMLAKKKLLRWVQTGGTTFFHFQITQWNKTFRMSRTQCGFSRHF